ncbi:hypothetical protein [Dyella caseinilytica]|uniref:Transmembrane protein n=1 Tax=Dyella caseinilytica TaxID=1849581 RepID=A0ABX7GSJ3_9GAMM|nr:hypothetical protein [Dyella caseinilytica]QRN53264.1 hypothetical protein ISN74_17810 [Dyella caseinilytica]GGA12703.1 hypothetical protein GCM10011408_37860 [Dyella caseinilytica]
MRRFSQKQYEQRVLVVMAIYAMAVLFAWPLLRTATQLPWKILLALAPVLPLIYLISLLARRIRTSDELEQRTHLIALGTAAAVTSTLGMIGGFLSIAGVLKLDGTILIWVFPVIMLSYSAVRWYVLRRYGVSSWCDEDAGSWFYLRFALVGVIILVIAALSHGELDDYRLGFVYGTGGGCMGAGLVLALSRWYRRRYRSE